MDMKKILNKKVKKQTVKDLKSALKDIPDETEIVLSFMLYDEGRESVYLAEIYPHMKYDPVEKEKLYDTGVVELLGYTHKMSTYIEKKNNEK